VSAALVNRICLILAFAGIFIAGFLSLSSILNVSIPCGGSAGCDAIATDPRSKWFGLPVAYFGLAGYLALALLAVFRSFNPDARLRWAGLGISAIGAIVSFYLMYLSLFVIKALCIWCLASAITMTLLFIVHGILVQSEGSTVGNNVDRILPPVLAVAVVVALAGFGMDLNSQKGASAQVINYAREIKTEALTENAAHSTGPENAPVQVIEFADFTCPHCKTSYQQLKEIVKASNGKIRMTYRHFPLYNTTGHEMSLPAALISEVVSEKGKFWDFADLVFALEDKPTTEGLLNMAESLGFDRAEVLRRISSPEDPAYDRVYKDVEMASKLGVQLTPAIYIGQKGQSPYPETINTYQERLNSGEFKTILQGQ